MRYISLSLAGLLLGAAFIALPASAATLTEEQIQSVIDLVESFGADEQSVLSVEAALRDTGSTNSKSPKTKFELKTAVGSSTLATSSASWLKLKAFLKKGSNGEDVTMLQKILASDPAIYPEGLVTGFFGPLTELAVKRLQAKLRIDQAGVIGPITLAKINELLAGITAEDLANARVKIEIKIKNGIEELKIEVKCDSSGSGNVCKDEDDDEDEEDEDEDEDDDEDDDDEEDDD